MKFRRPRGMAPLPTPQRHGTLDDLRAFVNVSSEADWILLVSWLISAFRPTGPYPILLLHGEQGTAKSTTPRVLRNLIDPNESPLRTMPRNERDLMIAVLLTRWQPDLEAGFPTEASGVGAAAALFEERYAGVIDVDPEVGDDSRRFHD